MIDVTMGITMIARMIPAVMKLFAETGCAVQQGPEDRNAAERVGQVLVCGRAPTARTRTQPHSPNTTDGIVARRSTTVIDRVVAATTARPR